jgi:hypothetical protein
MNATATAAFGLLIVTGCIADASAKQLPGGIDINQWKQIDPQLHQLCTTNSNTDAAEQTTLKTYTSAPLEKALLSSKAFWDFITDPSTPYLDRMAAANRGGTVLSVEDLPKLWQAMVEVQTVPSITTEAPCLYFQSDNLTPQMWADRYRWGGRREATTQVVIGREVQVPKEIIDYPVTAEERDHSPWLWQMKEALPILFTRLNRYYGDPSRYPMLVKAAWNWSIAVPAQPSADEKRTEWCQLHIRRQALTDWAPHDPLFLATIVKLALNNDDHLVAESAPVQDLNAWGGDSYHYEELAHAAQIAILQKTKWDDIAALAAFDTTQLARYRPYSDTPHLAPLQTSTAILAIGRWAMDKSLNPWNRYSSFVGPICKMMNNPPFPPDRIREPNDPKLDETLKTFDAWFEKERPALKKAADAELPHLQSLATELKTNIE